MELGWNKRRFELSGDGLHVKAYGIRKLEGKTGVDMGQDMAMFWGNGYEMYVVNMKTRQIRKFSDAEGHVLVRRCDIDMKSISQKCGKGVQYAQKRIQRYGCMNRFSEFKDGVAAISWMLYPDGRYFEDSDGFGANDNGEEKAYCVINRNLCIIRPFACVTDVNELLEETAKHKLRFFLSSLVRWFRIC